MMEDQGMNQGKLSSATLTSIRKKVHWKFPSVSGVFGYGVHGHNATPRLNRLSRGWRAIGILALASLAWVVNGSLAHSDSACVSFAELQHCPIGGVDLELPAGDDRLVVHNPGAKVRNGVSIDLPDTRSWVGESLVEFTGGANDVLRLASMSEGVVTSRAEAKRIGGGIALSATFTGSLEERMYRVDVLRDGVWQGGAGDMPSGLPGAEAQTSGVLQEYDMEFYVMASGACRWGFRLDGGSDHRIALPDGQTLIGDEILLTEQVKPAGGYPYTTFDRLLFQGNFVRLHFLSESFE
jgi:hypothetical protein